MYNVSMSITIAFWLKLYLTHFQINAKIDIFCIGS